MKIISVYIDAKCGGCNWECGKFYAFEGQNPLPVSVVDEDTNLPYDEYKEEFEEYKHNGDPVGMCSHCWADFLEEALNDKVL